MTSLTSTTFGAALIRGFLSEDLAGARWNFQHWLRGTYYASSPWTSHLRKSDLCIISKADEDPSSLVEPLAKAGWQLPTLFRVQDWQFRTPTSSNRFQMPRAKRQVVVGGSQFPFAALRFIIKGLTFANANHAV